MNNDISNFFRSCNECSQEFECKVVGKVPAWLNGSLIRLGPGRWDLEGRNKFTLNHWLDGCAMLIKFRIEDGRAFFSSKFLRSTAFNKMIVNGLPVFPEFGTRAYPDKTSNIFDKLINKLVPQDMSDNNISNLFLLNKRLFVCSESCNIWQVDPANISGVEKINVARQFHPRVNLISSHPLYSPKENCYYNIGTTFNAGIKYTILKIPATNEQSKNPFNGAEKLSVIPSRWKTSFSYIHSFAMSENFIVLIEQPLLISTLKLANCAINGRALEECMEWHPDEPTRFYVIKKSNGDEQCLDHEYETEAFFFFHVINAFEQDEHLIIDLVAYEDAKVLERYHLQFLRTNQVGDNCQPVLRRYVLPLESKIKKDEKCPGKELVTLPNTSASARINQGSIILTYEQITEPGFEMPLVNSSYIGQQNRYIYGSGTFEPGFFAQSAIKLDLKEREVKIWRPSDTAFPGEAVFVPKPDSKNEDDGIVLTVVLESDEEKDNLLCILDGPTMNELGRIMIPKNLADIPPTIHGLFIPNTKEIAV